MPLHFYTSDNFCVLLISSCLTIHICPQNAVKGLFVNWLRQRETSSRLTKVSPTTIGETFFKHWKITFLHSLSSLRLSHLALLVLAFSCEHCAPQLNIIWILGCNRLWQGISNKMIFNCCSRHVKSIHLLYASWLKTRYVFHWLTEQSRNHIMAQPQKWETLHFIALNAGKDKYSCVVNERPVQLEFNDSSPAYNSVTASLSHRHYFHCEIQTKSPEVRNSICLIPYASYMAQSGSIYQADPSSGYIVTCYVLAVIAQARCDPLMLLCVYMRVIYDDTNSLDDKCMWFLKQRNTIHKVCN